MRSKIQLSTTYRNIFVIKSTYNESGEGVISARIDWIEGFKSQNGSPKIYWQGT